MASLTQLEPTEVVSDLSPAARSVGQSRRVRIGSEVLVGLGFLAASVYVTWPLALHAGTQLPFNAIDPLLNAYIFSWVGHALAHSPLDLFNANAFFPDRLSLAFTESDIGQALPVAPLYWLTGNGVLTVNVAILLMYTVSGYGTYLLAREFGATRGPAFVGGIAFGLAPYRLTQIVHTHVIAMHFTPFVLLALLRLRSRPSRWQVLLFGFLFACQSWSSLSGGAITGCLVGVWCAWELALHRRLALPVLTRAASGLAIAGVLMIPLLVPYMQARREHPEYGHPSGDVVMYSATLRSWVSPGEGGRLARDAYEWLGRQTTPEVAAWEKREFPGFTLVLSAFAMAGAACWSLGRCQGRRPPWVKPAAFAAGIALTGFVLSLGPRMDATPNGFPLPFDLVNRLTPGRLLRVPARFGSLVPLGLGLLLALTLAGISSARRRRLAVGTVLVAFALELMPSQIPLVAAPRPNAAHRALAGGSGAVLALPTAEVGSDGGFYNTHKLEPVHLYLSTAHFRPIVNGYSAFEPRHWQETVKAVQDFPTAASMAALRQQGIDTVIVETTLAEGTRWETTSDRLRSWPGVRTLAEAGGTVVFDLAGAG